MGSQLYTTTGSNSFTVPSFSAKLIAWVAGAGAGGPNGAGVAASSNGGTSTFNSTVQGLGGDKTGSDGTATGGTTNTTGNGALGGNAGVLTPVGDSPPPFTGDGGW